MRIGFIINPIAGMGGRLGLKGTDGVVEAAIALGAEPVAPERAAQALSRLWQILDDEQPRRTVTWFTCSGAMGEDVLRGAGFQQITIVHQTPATPSADDTAAAVRALDEVKAARELIVAEEL